MKIIEVCSGVRSGIFNDEMIERTLSHSKFGDDYINDQSFISVKLRLESDDDYKAFLFRRLWECVYLKATQYSYILDSDEGITIVKISLSEAIRIIDSLTPPALKSKLQEFTSSVDHITTVLNDFLFDPKAGEYYRDAFIKSINMYQFPYSSNYDSNRIDHLALINSNLTVCDVIASFLSIDSLINVDPSDVSNKMMSTTVTFAIQVQNIRDLCNVLHVGYNVTSVVCNPQTTTIRCVVDSFRTFSNEYREVVNSGGDGVAYPDCNDMINIQSQSQNNDWILNVIRNTYKDILSK